VLTDGLFEPKLPMRTGDWRERAAHPALRARV